MALVSEEKEARDVDAPPSNPSMYFLFTIMTRSKASCRDREASARFLVLIVFSPTNCRAPAPITS